MSPYPHLLAGRSLDVRIDRGEILGLSAFLWCGVALFAVLQAAVAGDPYSLEAYVPLAISTAVAIGGATLIGALFKHLSGRPVSLAWIVLPAGLALAALLLTLADMALHALLAGLILGIQQVSTDARTFLVFWALHLCYYSLNAALMWIVSAHRHIHMQADALGRLESDGLRAELRALRLQLDPHFMFNALNAVSSLLVTGRSQDAEQMVGRLADFLRTSMDVAGEPLVRLDRELSIVDDYLAVEAVRFGDRLRVEVACETGLADLTVPNLLLQPIIENAVKYGVGRSRAPVTITLLAALAPDGRLKLVVCNSGPPQPAEEPLRGAGVGEANTRARLIRHYGAEAEFAAGPRDDGYRVEMLLPARPATQSDTAAPTSENPSTSTSAPSVSGEAAL